MFLVYLTETFSTACLHGAIYIVASSSRFICEHKNPQNGATIQTTLGTSAARLYLFRSILPNKFVFYFLLILISTNIHSSEAMNI